MMTPTTTPVLDRRHYILFFGLLAVVYACGLFVPLMDNDSAHHADIALHMYLTGDYVNLIDHGREYLDKPHLHFWLCALSYELFGVTGFAYKFPSLLFTILGTYSVFKIGKILYNVEAGRLAALIIASAFAYILANNDVRMDAILTATIAFSTWQLLAVLQSGKLIYSFGAALGLALAFSTKGHIGILVPAISAFSYIVYKKNYRQLYNWKLLLVVPLFALLIAPVVYCYYLQFNLHPEKVVRGKDHINGVKFILFGQSVERFQGDSFGGDSKHDYLFFLHSFLWAFAPWSVLAYIAVVDRVKKFAGRKAEWVTVSTFLLILLVVSFAGFKLPHYLNIVFPVASVFTAGFILEKTETHRWLTRFKVIQTVISILLLLLIATLTIWAFPVHHLAIIIFTVVLLSAYFRVILYSSSPLRRTISLSVLSITTVFFLLNTNFYPQLLKYQGGNELAKAVRGKLDPATVYFWKDTYSSSFNFYTASLRQQFDDSVLHAGKPAWLVFDIRNEPEIKAAGYELGKRFEAIDYEITKLDLKFINPVRRESQCTKLVVAEISKK